jgi:acyl-CoA thioester hydrolase
MEANEFELEFAVRDYECLLQGVVNNAVYLNYLEHARHEYLKGVGLDFAALHEAGCDLVVTRLEVDYKGQLRSGDRFVVSVRLERRSRLRFAFHQTIARLTDDEVLLDAVVVGTGIVNGRPRLPDEIQALLDGKAS